MKKLAIVLLGMVLLGGAALAEKPTDADQKWLAVVEKMVEQGKDTISTSSEARLELVRNWAATKGLSTDVKKTGQGFQVTFSKVIAQN